VKPEGAECPDGKSFKWCQVSVRPLLHFPKTQSASQLKSSRHELSQDSENVIITVSPLKKTDGFELNLTLLAKTFVLSKIQPQIKTLEKPCIFYASKSVKIKEIRLLAKRS
jgi:hypothetical protein